MNKTSLLNSSLPKFSRIILSLAVVNSIFILSTIAVNLDTSEFETNLIYIIASGFWLSLILEIILVVLTTFKRKELEEKGYKAKSLRDAQAGIVSFFKNFEASIADVILFICAISTVVIVRSQTNTQAIIIVDFSLLFLTFNLHCILNGKNYRYIKSLNQYKKRSKKDHGKNQR